MPTLDFADMLGLIEDRSRALRVAAAEAGLDARVPGCPDWSARDLVTHLAQVHLFWSAAVAAGPANGPPTQEQVGDREPAGDLLTWSADASAALVRSLSDAGPDRGSWTWWGSSGAPMTAGAVARHQVQEAAVHAFDAQESAGRAEPLPQLIAADGVGEYLTVGLASLGPWPHDPARVLLNASDGGIWQIDLGSAGARSERVVTVEDQAAAPAVTATGSPGDIVLVLYRRRPRATLQLAGDEGVFDRLLAWSVMD